MQSTRRFALRRMIARAPILAASAVIALGCVVGARAWIVDQHIRHNTWRIEEGMHRRLVRGHLGEPHRGEPHGTWTYSLLNSWDSMHIRFDEDDRVEHVEWY